MDEKAGTKLRGIEALAGNVDGILFHRTEPIMI